MAFNLGPPPDPKTGFESQSWQTWFYQLWQALKNAAKPFTGATGSTAGTSGLVPAPAAGQQNNVLFGNGSWGPKIIINTVATNSSGQWSVSFAGVGFTFNPVVVVTATGSGNTAATQYLASISTIGTSSVNGYVIQNGALVGAGVIVDVIAIGS